MKRALVIFALIGVCAAQSLDSCAARGADCTTQTCCADDNQRCFRQTTTRSRCRDVGTCPSNWICTVVRRRLPAYSECSGNAQIEECVTPAGSTAPFQCFRENSAYAQCRPQCPQCWACNPLNNNSALAQLQPGAVCTGNPQIERCVSAGNQPYACYRENSDFAQCRPVGDCPFWWQCAHGGGSHTRLALTSPEQNTGDRYFIIRVKYENTTTLHRALESLKLLHGAQNITEAMWHFLFEVRLFVPLNSTEACG